MLDIGVLGGGINGFCCALHILEHFQNDNKNDHGNKVRVTLISDKFTPNTTGDGSAGLWGPYLLNGTATENVYKWSKGTHDYLEKLWLSEDAGDAGICLIPVIRVTTDHRTMQDFWKNIVYGFQTLNEQQLNDLNKERTKKFTSGFYFVTYTSEPRKLLPYLEKRFRQQGGHILQQKIENFYDFIHANQYDIIVNCTGLNSRHLLNDTNTYAIRGQVARVQAPWLYYVLLDESDDGNYIIPNMDTVVLGGTHQDHDYNTLISLKDKTFIENGCMDMIKSLQNAPHLYDWVGLRPGRTSIRLEMEQFSKNKTIIHNYGHGGSGVTLSWGCATDVVQLVEKILQRKTKPQQTVSSKL